MPVSRVRPDVVIFAALLLGSAAAVATQLDHDPVPKAQRDRPRIGAKIPDFHLKDIDGGDRSLSELSKGKKAIVLMFWMVACPCVDEVQPRLQPIQDRYEKLGVAFVAIDSEPTDKRDEVFEKMARIRATYAMLLDPKQEVLASVGARQATDMVILDADGVLRYRGTFDDDLIKPKVKLLPAALDAVIEGRLPILAETAGYGCPFDGFEAECEAGGKKP
jgi:peroxiredoxin